LKTKVDYHNHLVPLIHGNYRQQPTTGEDIHYFGSSYTTKQEKGKQITSDKETAFYVGFNKVSEVKKLRVFPETRN